MENAKDIFINTIKDGQNINSLFLIKDMTRAETKNGKPYLMLTLVDRTGEIEGRVWENAERFESLCRPGSIVFVSAQSQTFRNNMQLKVSTIEAVEEKSADPGLFLPSAGEDIEIMFTDLRRLAKSVQDSSLKKLLLDFLDADDFAIPFKKAPAAKKMHHAYIGGLLEHTLSVARLADMVSNHYPAIDRSLLIAGAILHDIGKIDEYSFDSYPFDFTDQGRLVGHMVLGIEIIRGRIAQQKDFPAELGDRLYHLVLSHHGQHEFGSPVVPMMIEAFVLHFLDDLDAKMNNMMRLRDQMTEPGHQWTDFQRHLGRFLFIPGAHDDDVINGIGETAEAKTARKAKELTDSRQRNLFGQNAD